MIVGLVFGLATGVGLGLAIKGFVDGRRPKPQKPQKEYFCPDCRTFRTEQGVVHTSFRLVYQEESPLWGLEEEIMCLSCGQKNVKEWDTYLKTLARDGRLGPPGG